MGSGATQFAITQVSTFLVSQGRGVAITAAGRTELFHPLAESVETILGGLSTATKAKSGSRKPGSAPPPSMVEPIDLGKVGGKPAGGPTPPRQGSR